MPRGSKRGAPLTLLAIPGHGAPRWLIPNEVSACVPVLASWSPYRIASRVQWFAIRGSHRAGALPVLPQIRTIRLETANAVDWRALGWNGGDGPAFGIYIGTPGATRKAVIHLVDRASHTCAAIVKVPLATQAKSAIVREAETLRKLAEEQPVQAPALFYVDRDRGLSTQQFISGRPGRRRLRPEYLDLLRSLVSRDSPICLIEQLVQWETSASLLPEPENEPLRLAFAALREDQPLPACRVHGDFAPWNLRHRPHLPPALIDWEESAARGLPLEDAYHFLHIQDFLFAGRPALHAEVLMPFGNSLGLTPRQCRRLEIAYLAHAYLRCRWRNDHARAAFLTTTLAMANQEYASGRSAARPQRLPDLTVKANLRNGRAELFDGLIANLNAEKVAYCVLGGHDFSPESAVPDVDIMVRTRDRPRLPQLLMRTASSAGAALVQAIQHETTATYFILARADGGQVRYLDVDCYTDYRKDNRTWLLAGQLIANRRKHREFYVPSIPDEFTYYLLKKVLKQSITPQQLKRLQHLLARNPAECRERIAQFWPAKAAALERTISQHDLRRFRQQLPELKCELQASCPVEPPLSRFAGKLRELWRCLRRVLRPTGMWVLIAGADFETRTRVAEELADALRPAFRRRRLLTTSGSGLAVFADRIRSTLVIHLADHTSAPFSRSAIGISKRVLSPDLTIVLGPGAPQPPREGDSPAGVVHLSAAPDSEKLVQHASQAVLQWLAARLRAGYPLQELPAGDAHDPQLSPAVTD